MKRHMILPVGVLTYLVCFGGVNASAFDWLRLAGDEAVLEEPAPLESEGGKLEATQKGLESACQKSPACQKGCEPFSLPCRPRLRGWGHAACEPACGVEQKCGPVSQKDCGPVCQKGPAWQKSCEPFALPCRPRLRGWGHAACEPACGVEQKCGPVSQKDCGPVCQKGPACQKSCEPFALPCRPRLLGWGHAAVNRPAASSRNAVRSARRTAAPCAKKGLLARRAASRSHCPAARGCGAGAKSAVKPRPAASQPLKRATAAPSRRRSTAARERSRRPLRSRNAGTSHSAFAG